ncbi:MAG: CotH kinase family protein [Bacteroidota bacterium]
MQFRQLYLLFFFLSFIAQSNAQLVINEYSAHKGLEDLGDSFDWIELYNSGTNVEDLSQYFLSDNGDNLQKWNLPNVELGPSEFIVFCASGKDISQKEDHWESIVLAEDTWSYFPAINEPPSNWNSLNFDDSFWPTGQGGFGYGDGDDNTLVQNVPSAYLRKKFQISDLNDVLSILFHPDFDDAYVAYINGIEIGRSPNIEGNPPSFDQAISVDIEAQLYQGIVPEPIFMGNDLVNSLFVEGENILAIQVHNFSSSSSDFSSNFYLSASILSEDFNYQDLPTWFPDQEGISFYHTNFKLGESEPIILTKDGIIADFILSDNALRNAVSKGRQSDGNNNWCYFDSPSPGASNENAFCYEGFASEPEINYESGWYQQTIELLALDPEQTIRFTTNGDVPDELDPIFNQSMEVFENSSMSFRAFSVGNLLPSKITDRIFIFEEDNHELPVFSIYSDSLGVWDFNEGIYVFGPNAGSTVPYFGSNFWQPWSRFTRLEYFNKDKVKVAEENFDLEIHGGWSRSEPQKSFRFDFKSAYTGNIDHAFFQNKPDLSSFNNLNIRNGGQHNWSDKLQDALIARLAYDTNIDNSAFQPAILYLNGEYWGLYGIREKLDQHYIAQNHNADPDSIDLLNSFGILNGTSDHFIEAYNDLMLEDVNSPLFYNLFQQNFDADNYIDYFAVQTYIQNMDWMGIAWGANNIKLWRPQTSFGKWRYMLFDTDAAFGYFGQNVFQNYIEFARSPSYPSMHSQIFDKLLDNNEFRCKFAQRSADLMNTSFQPTNISNQLDLMKAEMNDAMFDHINRWQAPASMGTWLGSISNIENYAEQRLGPARNQLSTSLNLGEQFTVDLDVFPPGAGSIQINSISPENYPWEGIYFGNCPIQIQAIPNEGFTFQNWTINNHLTELSFDISEIIQLFSNDTFVANFTNEPIGIEQIDAPSIKIIPNPNKGLFTLIMDQNLKINSWKVFDSIGREVRGNKNGIHTIDMSDEENGIYLLLLNTEHGDFYRRIVISK